MTFQSRVEQHVPPPPAPVSEGEAGEGLVEGGFEVASAEVASEGRKAEHPPGLYGEVAILLLVAPERLSGAFGGSLAPTSHPF